MHHKTYGFLEISGGIDVNSLKNRIILKAKFGDDSYVKLYLQERKTHRLLRDLFRILSNIFDAASCENR